MGKGEVGGDRGRSGQLLTERAALTHTDFSGLFETPELS